jgi:hypothetical protein
MLKGGKPKSGSGLLDFDEEAKQLWEKLNLDPTSRKNGQWNPVDSIWRYIIYFLEIVSFLNCNIEGTLWEVEQYMLGIKRQQKI